MRLPRWRRRARRHDRPIDAGTVACPIAGTDVDVEQCFTCTAFLRLVEDDERQVTLVRCRPEPPNRPVLDLTR